MKDYALCSGNIKDFTINNMTKKKKKKKKGIVDENKNSKNSKF